MDGVVAHEVQGTAEHEWDVEGNSKDYVGTGSAKGGEHNSVVLWQGTGGVISRVCTVIFLILTTKGLSNNSQTQYTHTQTAHYKVKELIK